MRGGGGAVAQARVGCSALTAGSGEGEEEDEEGGVEVGAVLRGARGALSMHKKMPLIQLISN